MSNPNSPHAHDTVQIAVVRYVDGDGQPTCAVNFVTGEVCQFYATQKFGCGETCWFADKSGKAWASMQRRKDGMGTLIPLQSCPVWPNGVAMVTTSATNEANS